MFKRKRLNCYLKFFSTALHFENDDFIFGTFHEINFLIFVILNIYALKLDSI